jgi:23S rRNA pseudouridine955/2504/2580 synthase
MEVGMGAGEEKTSRGRDIPITEDHAERRVDRICRTLYRHVPLGAIMKAIRKGEVRLNGRRTKPDARPSAGDILRVPWENPENMPEVQNSQSVQGAQSAQSVSWAERGKRSLDVPVLYQDEYLLVADKPPGLLSQPDTPEGDSLITRIWKMVPPRQDFRPAAVHRLDRNTSGILLVALRGSLLRELHRLWQEDAISKMYRAVVVGNPGKEGEIREPLWKNEKENRVYVDPRGASALTRYRTLASSRNYSLLEVELCTGRPHQIRVHLAHLGHPVVGDYKYGDEGVNRRVRSRGVRRPLLHAFRMILPLMPSPWENLSEKSFTAPLPGDFTDFFPGSL